MKLRQLVFTALALIIMLSGLGLEARPAQAASCIQFHIVRARENFRMISNYYKINWRNLVHLNDNIDPRMIEPGDKLCLAHNSGGIIVPPVKIMHVERDAYITIKGTGYPLADSLKVVLGDASSASLEGIEVGTVKTGDEGIFKVKFDIPEELKEADTLGIRLESADYGFYTYKWFHNIDSYPAGYGPVPVVYVQGVSKGKDFTLKLHNMPANTTFEVWMRPFGDIFDGYTFYVGDVVTGEEGGSLIVSVAIPHELHSFEQLGVTLQNQPLGYNLFKWFDN